MLKKIKSKNSKTNSMLDFVLELNQKYKIKNIKLEDRGENKKLEREKRRFDNKKTLTENFFNDHSNLNPENLFKKHFKEDQENMKYKNVFNPNNTLALKSNNKTITEFFKLKSVNKSTNSHIDNKQDYNNNSFRQNNFFKNLNVNSENFSKYFAQSKGKFVEFFDELNKRCIKFTSYDEKDLKFCKSKILPQIKLMKLDNDVLTEDEQIKDATTMLKDNIKEAIKTINSEGKEYLQKNLSRKMIFKKK